MRCLSIFHPKSKILGPLLTGIFTFKLSLGAIAAYLNKSVKETDYVFIGVDQTSLDSVFQISDAISEVNINPVLTISKQVVEEARLKNLEKEEQLKVARLEILINKMNNTVNFKIITIKGGQYMSLLTCLAACVAINTSGQSSPAAYWLTLINWAIDPVFDYAEKKFILDKLTSKNI